MESVASWPAGAEQAPKLERDKKIGAAGELYISPYFSVLVLTQAKRVA